MKSFRSLSIPAKLSIVLLYLRINLKIVFGIKALWCAIALVIYIAVFTGIAYNSEDEYTIGSALPLFVWIPLTIIAVLFSMDIISKERDANLIETLFTVSVSVYRLWIIKYVTLMTAITALATILIIYTNIVITRVPIFLGLISVLPPILFFCGITMLLSVMLKGANSAGMAVTAIIAFVVLISEGIATTVAFPYLNPFDMPPGQETFVWIRDVVYNKIAFTILGGVSFWRAMKWLDRRERLLK